MTTMMPPPLPMPARGAMSNAVLMQKARESLRGHFGNAVLLLLLHLVPTLLFVSVAFGYSFYPAMCAPSVLALHQISGQLYNLLGVPFINVFFCAYCLACIRNEPTQLRVVFNAMPGYWRTILFWFLLSLLIFACVFGAGAALVGILGLIGYFMGIPQAFILLGVVGGGIGTIGYLWFLLGLFPVYFLFVDAPWHGTIAIFQTSFRLMNGYKWKAFCLWCRFIGWFLLVPFTFGVAGLFVIPYFVTACAAFYEDIRPLPVQPPPLPQPEAAPAAATGI